MLDNYTHEELVHIVDMYNLDIDIDKMKKMSKGMLVPKVIVRVAVGARKPLDGGEQHTQDFTKSIECMLTDTTLVELTEPEQIFDTFVDAYDRNGSTVIVEWGDFYSEK